MLHFPGFADHESLHLFEDKDAGFTAAIAIHSTALGPAAGGCRVWDYDSTDALSRDALALARAMSYKSAIAQLPLGGGKTVIYKPRNVPKTPALFAALGRAVQSLNGRYWAAEDVGVSPQDLAHAARHCDYISGLDTGKAASGDPSPLTARGLFLGMQAAARLVLGTETLSDVRIAVQGVGGVGGYLCQMLTKAGAKLTLTDIDTDRLQAVAGQTGAKTCAPEAIYDVDAEIFSPNALGGTIHAQSLKRLRCKLIAGGANNQLADPALGTALQAAKIVYAPDYVINGGGIINLAGEIIGNYDPDWVEMKLHGLAETLVQILQKADQTGQPPHQIADAMAQARLQGQQA